MRIIITALLCLAGLSIAAQTYVGIPWREGTITKDGKEMQGIIRLGGDLNARYLNHAKVYFVKQEDVVEGKKPKKKLITEYKPDDIDGYSTYTETEDGERVDMDFISAEIMVPGMVKAKKGMAFLEYYDKGKVDAFGFIPMAQKTKVVGGSRDVNQANSRATVYVRKDGGKLEKIVDSELTKLLSDCPAVVEKIENETYGFKPKNKRKKKKGLKKMMSSAVGDNNAESKMLKAIYEYNECN